MLQSSISYIILDDDDVDRYMIETFADTYSILQLKGSFSNPVEAVSFINSVQPNLLFLDIDMPQASGISVLKTVRDVVPMAVFVTSHPEYATEGFELSALDYIVKPITEARFEHCLRRVTEYWEMKQKSAAYDVMFEEKRIMFKDGYEQVWLKHSDILYLEAMHDYTKIITDTKKYMTNATLSMFMEKLPVDNFIRVHRSYVVSKNKIEKIKTSEVICAGMVIPIGKTYRPFISKMLL